MNILIVDDEPLILKGLTNIIKQERGLVAEIRSAVDGIDALEQLEGFQPDIVITDIYMPEMNGFELIESVLNRGICKRFVILTGYDDFELARKAIRLQTIDYLLKPVNKVELLDILEKVSKEIKALPQSDLRHPILTGGKSNYSESIEKILDYIAIHYKCDMSLESIAELVYLHPNYVSILFKKETGVTFIRYLHTYRTNRAKEIISQDPEIAFSKVAGMVGYENPGHFFKIFKKFTGVTPGQFRDTHGSP